MTKQAHTPTPTHKDCGPLQTKRAPFPGNTADKWRTKRGMLTQRARRYLRQRDADHYAFLRDNIWSK